MRLHTSATPQIGVLNLIEQGNRVLELHRNSDRLNPLLLLEDAPVSQAAPAFEQIGKIESGRSCTDDGDAHQLIRLSLRLVRFARREEPSCRLLHSSENRLEFSTALRQLILDLRR